MNYGDVYCFRVINNDGSVLGGYSVTPEFTIATPTVTQANYRWFANADSITPGAPLAAQDTAATIAAETPFRLRQRLAVDAGQLSISQQNYRLQFGEKVTTCSVASYGDIAGNTGERYASSVSQDSSGTLSWSAVSDMKIKDGLLANVGTIINSGQTSNIASLTDYGMSIPAGATITGIELTVRIGKSGGYSAGIHPGITGVPGAIEKNLVLSVGSNQVLTFGGEGDLFGASSISVSDVNNVNFGSTVWASLKGSFGDPTDIDIDSVSVKVFYDQINPLSYYQNLTPGSGDTIASSGNDPTNSGRTGVYQTYLENDPFTNTVAAIPSGQDGMWDFVLTTDSSVSGKTYCFRVVGQDGSPIDTYSQYPEITFGSPGGSGPTLDQQLRGGQAVLDGAKKPFSW